jgi:hypothetical protein
MFVQSFGLFSANTSGALRPSRCEFTIVECRDRLLEPFFQVTARQRSTFASKPAHPSRHLPLALIYHGDIDSDEPQAIEVARQSGILGHRRRLERIRDIKH